MTLKSENIKLSAHALTCEYRIDPLGVESPNPRLSWKVAGSGRHVTQRSYQVLVASTPDLLAPRVADLWETGEIQSDQSVHIPYAGDDLGSGQTYFWTVRIWDANGNASEFAPAASWTMGMLEQSDWRAQWIAPSFYPDVQAGSQTAPSPLMRKEANLRAPIKSAHAFISGLGYHELGINGVKVGDQVLSPTVARYDLRTMYVVHDITAHLKQGANAFGVMLGNGWYNCQTTEVWSFEHAPWRDKPKLRMQVHIEYADGTSETLLTDTSWRSSTGPIVRDALRNGEEYDARLEKQGWDMTGYDDAEWSNVVVIPAPGGILASEWVPARVTNTLTPKSVTEVKPGVWICDVGQNMTGWAQLSVNGPAGSTITLKYSENLAVDGDIDQSNIDSFIKSGECQTDRYTLKGGESEVWEPRFTYHGFRYVQITGFPGTPTVDSLRARVVRTDFEPAGDFSCSNDILNRTFANTRWSYISNYVGIPTDCPHREKNGWTGDACIAAETGLSLYNGAPAYTKWLDDISDSMRPSGQLPGIVPTGGWGYNWGSGPAWDSVFTHIPWYLYIYDADTGIIERHYEKMKHYVDYMTSMATDNILSFGLGDWCPPGGDPNASLAPATLTSTGYYYANCKIVSRAAHLLGRREDSLHYEALAETVKAAFNNRFYDRESGFYEGKCQTSQSCALYQGLVEPGQQELAFKRFVELVEADGYHSNFGILGGKYALNALTAGGRTDVAYKIAAQTTYPSWGYWIEQGMTTLGEQWDLTNSRNHIMFGDIAAWMMKALAGIQPDPEWPGFKHFYIRPATPEGLTWATGARETIHGPIKSAWKLDNGLFTLEVDVPANTTATVTIPRKSGSTVTESGKPLDKAPGVIEAVAAETSATVTIGSGSYVFAAGI